MVDGNAQKVTYGDFEEDNCRETFGSFMLIQVEPKSSMICSPYSGMGDFIEDYYKLEDGKLEHVVKLVYHSEIQGSETYYVDEKEVSKKEYLKEEEVFGTFRKCNRSGTCNLNNTD